MAVTTSRYSISRQKACQQCSISKVKCKRKNRGRSCVRCWQRGVVCVLPQPLGVTNLQSQERLDPLTVSGGPSGGSWNSQKLDNGLSGDVSSQGDHANIKSSETAITKSVTFSLEDSKRANNLAYDDLEVLDFSHLDLICPINVEDIGNRWLNPYIAVPGQTVKKYPKTISNFIYRILKSYSAVATHGRTILPFVHPVQIMAGKAGSPLSTCLSLVQICSSPLPGSETTVAGILEREMKSLYEKRGEYNQEELLSAFQAYLIYVMVLYFGVPEACEGGFREKMTKLQDLACCSSRGGLICAADRTRIRPRWEEWVVVESKRRTLFVMYLFDNLLSTQESIPTFLATELRGLPAPAAKTLWQSHSRYGWEKEYNVHMAEWTEGILTIDELWPFDEDMRTAAIAQRRARVDHWLENIDEYGTALYAIMSCTHGG
jgi:hypothetical protein